MPSAPYWTLLDNDVPSFVFDSKYFSSLMTHLLSSLWCQRATLSACVFLQLQTYQLSTFSPGTLSKCFTFRVIRVWPFARAMLAMKRSLSPIEFDRRLL